LFPAWFLGRNPDKRIIHTSYAASLSNEWSRKTRDLVEDELFRAIFGVTTDPDVRATDCWSLHKHRGGMISSGVGGSLTGHGADLLIIDDPVKNAEEAESETFRERAYNWYKSVARTRLEPDAGVILMMARWHQKDLAGMILAEEKDWVVINLTAIAEEGDPLGRAPGAALWPDRFGLSELESIRADIGSRFWGALFCGSPVDPSGSFIKRSWVQPYIELPVKTSRFAGIDTATSKKTAADNMSMVDVCTDKEGFLYVDDVFLEQVSVTAFARFVSGQHQTLSYRRIDIESNNAGEAVKQRIDEVGREDKTMPPVHGVVADTDKVVRLMAYQHLIENGTIKFKMSNPRVKRLVDHLLAFTGKDGDDDDDIDALGHAINAARKYKRDIVHFA
jgi:predicted phage terminase large subunit-like protein